MNAWSSYTSSDNDPVAAQVAVEVVPLYGKGSQEHFFISGNMYQCQPESNEQTRIDTYQIVFTDDSTATFTVTNGEKGETGAPGADGKDDVGESRRQHPRQPPAPASLTPRPLPAARAALRGFSCTAPWRTS